MHARTAARAISAAAMAGGLAVAFGPAPAASAMTSFEEGSSSSVGHLCQEAVATLASSETPPFTIEGLPGLRCGQAFGTAHVDHSESDDTEDEVEESTFEAEDDDSDEAEVEDDAEDETEVEDDGEHHVEDHGDDHDEFEAEDDDSDEDVDEDSDDDSDDDEGEDESDS